MDTISAWVYPLALIPSNPICIQWCFLSWPWSSDLQSMGTLATLSMGFLHFVFDKPDGMASRFALLLWVSCDVLSRFFNGLSNRGQIDGVKLSHKIISVRFQTS